METQPKILVQIASYRDPECQWTVRDLFDKAAHPDRVFVAICWQFIPELDTECFRIHTRPEQVRIVTANAVGSRGVCWARNQTQQLWQGEEFTLQIDSHTRFAAGWDRILLEDLNKCPSAKSLISCDPPAYTPPNNLSPRPSVTFKRAVHFQTNGVMRFKGEPLRQMPERPLRGAFIAAGFMFSASTVIREVPYDPHLYYDQEEATLSARLYTHGWDVFSPTGISVYHYYNPIKNGKSLRPLHHHDNKKWGELQARAIQRYNRLMGNGTSQHADALVDIENYEMGTVRSLEDYFEFCGVDFGKRVVLQRAQQAEFIEELFQYCVLPLNVPPAANATVTQSQDKNAGNVSHGI